MNMRKLCQYVNFVHITFCALDFWTTIGYNIRMTELCQSCVGEGRKECFFVSAQKRIVGKLPLSEKQTPLINGSGITVEAFEAEQAIEDARTRARDIRSCPQVNYQSRNPKLIKNL